METQNPNPRACNAYVHPYDLQSSLQPFYTHAQNPREEL
jgi:hypothetical protein